MEVKVNAFQMSTLISETTENSRTLRKWVHYGALSNCSIITKYDSREAALTVYTFQKFNRCNPLSPPVSLN